MSRRKNPLWFRKSDSLVDIFKIFVDDADIEENEKEIDMLFQDIQKKDHEYSTMSRLAGNNFHSKQMYLHAMEKYNESACFARNDSEALGLAYANRSTCFLKLSMYKECLVDIELAKKFNYPKNLWHKLEARRAECERALSKSEAAPAKNADDQQPSLSFDEHPVYAGAAECLEIKNSNNFGRHIITKCNLTIGQTVLFEEAYGIVDVGEQTNSSRYSRCSKCFKKGQNFIPCENCVYSMFCSETCHGAGDEFHHIQACEMPKNLSHQSEREFELVVDLLFKAIDSFESVDGMIQFVTSLVDGGVVDALGVKQQKFAMIFQLATNKDKKSNENLQEMVSTAMQIYSVIMRSPIFENRFNTDERKRFLQHLVLHHCHIVSNASDVFDLNVEPITGHFHAYGYGMYPVGCYFNHSCVPNVFCYFVGRRMICKVLRPIRSGEQLFRSYFNNPGMPGMELQAKMLLKSKHHLECNCCVCCPKPNRNKKMDNLNSKKDPIYSTIMSPVSPITNIERMTENELRSIESKAIEFLNKYNSMHPVESTILMEIFLQQLWVFDVSHK